MRRHLVVAATLAAALALPSLAAAKGPESASISGAGVRSLVVHGQGEMGPGTPLGTLVDLGGYFSQMFGQVPDPTLRARPKGTLGPSYRVTYVVPGPNGVKSRVVQELYPYARPVPLTHMQPGQVFWGNQTTYGGWFRASADLERMLVRTGLPVSPPPTSAGFWSPGAIGGLASALVLLAVAAVTRPWRKHRLGFGSTN